MKVHGEHLIGLTIWYLNSNVKHIANYNSVALFAANAKYFMNVKINLNNSFAQKFCTAVLVFLGL